MHAPHAAAARYRDLDLAARVAGASPHQLVTMLFDGLKSALSAAERAVGGGRPAAGLKPVTRALAILDALEGALDFGAGAVARTLAALYAELRMLVVAGSAAADPALFATAAARVAELGAAWRRVSPPAAA